MSSSTLSFYVNGNKVTARDVSPQQTLLQFLRNDLRLRGTKLACGEGRCGSCTVMVSDKDEHKSVVSCLTPVCSMHGLSITTIEGVNNGVNELHPIQKRLADGHGTQCGYCSPGMVMSMYSLLSQCPAPQLSDIEDAIRGNFCRCTGYGPILESFYTFAVEDGAKNDINSKNRLTLQYEDLSLKFIDSELRVGGENVVWIRPLSVERLVTLKSSLPESVLVAGNTTLGTRVQKGTTYVCINHLSELKTVTVGVDGIRVGSAVTLSTLEREISRIIDEKPEPKTRFLCAILTRLKLFSGKQIKNMATIGGTVMSANFSSDLLPLLMCAKCTIKVISSDGISEFVLDDEFFVGNSTRLSSAQIIHSIKLPFSNENEHFYAMKQFRRSSVVNCGFKLTLDGFSVADICLVFGGLCSSAFIVASSHFTSLLRTMEWNETLLSKSLELLEEEFSVFSSLTKYQRTLISAFFFKFYVFVWKKINSSENANMYDDVALQNPDRISLKNVRVHETVSKDQSDIDQVGRSIPHLSSLDHVTGKAVYCDDSPKFADELYLRLVLSRRARARVVSIDATEALQIDGVKLFLSAADLSADKNKFGVFVKDEPIFAIDQVECVGQIIGAIVAVDADIAKIAVERVRVVYDDLFPIVLTIQDAIESKSFYDCQSLLSDGDVAAGFSSASRSVSGEFSVGGQKHFYMETHSVIAVPKIENDEMEIFAALQDISGLQSTVASVLGVPANRITCRNKRIGGAFGGKGTRGIPLAAIVSLAAHKLSLPVRCKLDRVDDMLMMGGRHPYLARYKIGFTDDGKIVALELDLFSNGGYSLDLSSAVMEYTMTSVDNCYKIPNILIRGIVCRTNTASCTSFRGFGALQGFAIIEHIIEHVASELPLLPPELIRERNMYRDGDFTPYAQQLIKPTIQSCWEQCLQQSNYAVRRLEVDEFNRKNRYVKRGLSILPLKFGIGFIFPVLNQGGALVHVYTDGSVLLAHGGVEMGQGLHTKMKQIAGKVLDIPLSKIFIGETSTAKVPNASSSAASTCSEIYGAAVLNACETLRDRLSPYIKNNPQGCWSDWINAAYYDGISLSATGFYKIPDLTYDFKTKKGNLFNYFSFGTGCTEVEVDCLTGTHRVLRVDLVMDVGRSLNPAIDFGQIEGSFLQGIGYFTMEEVCYDLQGQLITNSASTYKIPSCFDIPRQLHVSFLKDCPNPRGIYSSKSVGECAICLSSTVFFAIRDATRSLNQKQLNSPATPENVRLSCTDFNINPVPE